MAAQSNIHVPHIAQSEAADWRGAQETRTNSNSIKSPEFIKLEDYFDRNYAHLIMIGECKPAWYQDERIARKVLSSAGMPTEAGYFIFEGDKWIKWDLSDAFSLDAMRDLNEVPIDPRFPSETYLIEICKRRFGERSHVDYAARIITNASLVQIARAGGLPLFAEYHAYCIGSIWTEWMIKWRAEEAWRIGESIKAGGRKGPRAKNGSEEDRKERDRQVRSTVERLCAGGMGITEARHQAAKLHGMSYSTVRRVHRPL
jgi:hypothetical protein